ncbi:AT-hook motif nuclear-localized protein 14-like isoform X2 [Mangifera indica]|uniref:AT-hook motif nuclear-localized protein 14-like isoform X2 n=1 Tax=Mangifera indica TaxID=29780 RepID=UPI001CF95EE2|nr:AT-hook motif nuclear-localized protein 14-like isoform X2 [Mangifera indica]
MEPDDTRQLSQLSSYFHHHHHHHHLLPSPTTASVPSATAATSSPTNGLLPPSLHTTNNDEGAGSHHHQHNSMVYHHSVASSAVNSPLEPAKRKRGRPRKYGTPEQALAARKTASSSNSKEKREQQQDLLVSNSSSPFSKKSQLVGFGNSGQGFTPHVISVAVGEDVLQKIMMFMQQIKCEICILSASGSISNASLRQPATSGGNITYEGRFEIISLSGSYVRTEIGGRTGGLSVCLSSSDGQIIGGGVGGPLKAAGPVQIDSKKDVNAGIKGEASGSKLPSPVGGASVSSIGFRSPIESSGRNPIRGNDDFQTIGVSHFMIQPSGMHVSPSRTEWRSTLDARTSAGYDLTGRTGHGAHQSPENGDYDQIPD